MSISAPASAPRSARSSPKSSTSPLRASSWCSAIPRTCPNQGADHRQRDHPDHRGAAAQGRRAGAALSARARGGAAGAAGRRAADRGRADPRPRQSQRQLWRIDRRRDHSPRTCRRCRRSKRSTTTSIVGQSVPRVDLPGQGHRRTGLCARHPRARHAARPRGAPALCRRRCRRFRRHQPDRGRRSPRCAIFPGWSPW